MEQFLRTLWQDESGQDLTEYALLVALISVVLVGTLVIFRDAIIGVFTEASGALEAAPDGP